MKKILILLLCLIGFLGVSASAKAFVDTTDSWNIKYNDKIVARNNDFQIQSFTIKASTIKTGDILTVNYFNDSPSENTQTGIYMFGNRKNKVILANGKGIRTPLKIEMKDILDKIRYYKRNVLNLYYFGQGRNFLICKLVLK